MSLLTFGRRVLSIFRYPPVLCGVTLAIFISVGVPKLGLADGPDDDPRTTEGWAWSKIRQGEAADLNEHCGTPRLDPNDEKDTRWQRNCRKLSARFLQDLLTRAPRREAVPLGGIGIAGATFDGDVNLTDVQLIRTLVISYSRVEGQFDLSNARTDSRISMDHFVVTGAFKAENLHSESGLDLQNGVFKKEVKLNGAKIGGSVNLSGNHFEAPLQAETLEVGGLLDMGLTSFKTVDLTGAKIAGQVLMLGSSFEGPFTAALAQIGGSLLMGSLPQYTTKFKAVNLFATKVAEDISLNNTSFDGDFAAGSLRVGGNLFMIGSSVSGQFDGNSLNIGGDLSMNGARLKNVYLQYAKWRGISARTVRLSMDSSMPVFWRSTATSRSALTTITTLPLSRL